MSLTRESLLPPYPMYALKISTEIQLLFGFSLRVRIREFRASSTSSEFDVEPTILVSDLCAVNLHLHETWYLTPAVCKSLKAPSMRTLTVVHNSSSLKSHASRRYCFCDLSPVPSISRHKYAGFHQVGFFRSFSNVHTTPLFQKAKV